MGQDEWLRGGGGEEVNLFCGTIRHKYLLTAPRVTCQNLGHYFGLVWLDA